MRPPSKRPQTVGAAYVPMDEAPVALRFATFVPWRITLTVNNHQELTTKLSRIVQDLEDYLTSYLYRPLSVAAPHTSNNSTR